VASASTYNNENEYMGQQEKADKGKGPFQEKTKDKNDMTRSSIVEFEKLEQECIDRFSPYHEQKAANYAP